VKGKKRADSFRGKSLRDAEGWRRKKVGARSLGRTKDEGWVAFGEEGEEGVPLHGGEQTPAAEFAQKVVRCLKAMELGRKAEGRKRH